MDKNKIKFALDEVAIAYEIVNRVRFSPDVSKKTVENLIDAQFHMNELCGSLKSILENHVENAEG